MYSSSMISKFYQISKREGAYTIFTLSQGGPETIA